MAKRTKRDRAIINDAINGLTDYYRCLRDPTVRQSVEGGLCVPKTGDDQLDYENVRDQVEKAARTAEATFMDD